MAAADAFPGTGYDLVATFDCLHDMGDPVAAARHIRQALAPDGTWMLVEPYAEDTVAGNLNPVGRLYHGFSTFLCVPHAVSEHAVDAPGNQAGEPRMRKIAAEAGFTRFRRAAETPSTSSTRCARTAALFPRRRRGPVRSPACWPEWRLRPLTIHNLSRGVREPLRPEEVRDYARSAAFRRASRDDSRMVTGQAKVVNERLRELKRAAEADELVVVTPGLDRQRRTDSLVSAAETWRRTA